MRDLEPRGSHQSRGCIRRIVVIRATAWVRLDGGPADLAGPEERCRCLDDQPPAGRGCLRRHARLTYLRCSQHLLPAVPASVAWTVVPNHSGTGESNRPLAIA